MLEEKPNIPKVKKPKRKVNKLNLWATIISVLAILALICLIVGIIVIALLLKDKPQIDIADFEQQESSTVYDATGEEIANLGNVIRTNIEYEELPNCVVDAFVAIEDSRFFEHNGFDIPRFTKAFIEDIIAMSFEQGGSTFTMQLVKNTYFTNDETGEEASREGMSGIKRKAQEIALALELENVKSKQDIFESYVNKLNFGGDYNIRGIEKASQYYFGKSVTECNLVEGALLAGVINAPSANNPFYHLENAQDRTTEVLYQMLNHGYITREEYDLAKTIRVENLLHDPYSSNTDSDGIAYQAYVDQVVSEVIDLTGLDPYSTTMHIYTYMNKGIQETMDKIQAGDFEEDYLYYPDDYLEVASICVNNQTGAIVGILGGRNYAKGGQLLLNHATEQYKQPGSTMKPILDYALAFENLGWATDHVLTDKPMWLDATNAILVSNDSGTYVGDVTLSQAVGNSINTCAVQTLQAVLDAKKYEYVVNYTQDLGYNFNLDDFNVQYAIGGSTCEVTPYQHAAAYASIMNLGTYNTPHTVARIEFTNGKSPITPTYKSKQVISEAAAYLTTELMYSNVQSYGGTYSYVKTSDYPVYGKTGTTDFGKEAVSLGVPSGSIKDGWLIAATSEYTTATWVGYERIVQGQQSYIKKDYYYNERPNGKIAHLILDATVEYGENQPSKIQKPSGVSGITHVLGTWPYAQWTEGMSESLKSYGQIKSDSIKLVSLPSPTVDNLSSGLVKVDGDQSSAELKISWAKYPDENKLKVASDQKDISLKSGNDVVVSAVGKCLFDYTMLYGPIQYKADITVEKDGKTETYKIRSSDNEATQIIGDVTDGATIKYTLYYGYENADFESNKISDKIPVEKSAYKYIVIPSEGTDRDSLKSWCDSNKVEWNESEEDEHNEGGTFYLKYDKDTYYAGDKVKVLREGTKPELFYYKVVNRSVKITEGNNNTFSFSLTNINDKDSTYSYQWIVKSGHDYTTNNEKLIIDKSSSDEPIRISIEVEYLGRTYKDSYTKED